MVWVVVSNDVAEIPPVVHSQTPIIEDMLSQLSTISLSPCVTKSLESRARDSGLRAKLKNRIRLRHTPAFTADRAAGASRILIVFLKVVTGREASTTVGLSLETWSSETAIKL